MTGRAEAAALAPVRTRILREARMEADRIVELAHAEAAAIVRQARRSADEAVALAWTRGQADGAQAAAAERSRGREQARLILFGAQREAHEELRGQVLAAVGGLRDEPGYERLLSRLTAMAARTAGPDAAITVQPTGGVIARSRGVVVDCTLPKLASLAVDALGSEVRELWTP
ncbi:MAG TPA: V-type ATP synthase subunit E [Streptosporangiaceae bacterium]|nr:V-type ATP synthase subunit E [Streptosporangiaceae bacterium]